MQHELGGTVHVVDFHAQGAISLSKSLSKHVVAEYDLDTLGAPFQVVLVNSVCASKDQTSGSMKVSIPDMAGLIMAIVRSRVTHPRKLSGPDIKFIRKALGVQAKLLAEFLELSPEHLSRCESGKHGVNLSSASEKQLRFAAFLGSFFEEPQTLFRSGSDLDSAPRKPTKQDKSFDRLVKLFFTMKIQTFHNPDEVLVLKLTRRAAGKNVFEPCGAMPGDGEWDGDEPIAA